MSVAFRVDPMFQDHMILQREKEVNIWGTGKPGLVVEVSIQGKQGSAPVKPDGSWQVSLPALTASACEILEVRCGQDTKQFCDVAIGEVWVAAGQSNMEFQLCFEKHWDEVCACPPNDMLRFYDVPEVAYPGQQDDFDYSRVGVWRKALPEDLKYFSAVGYYFQKQLQLDLDVPVGIVGCNWGGTTSCAWMRQESVAALDNYWWKKYLSLSEGMNWTEFYQKQKLNPLNDRGNVMETEFTRIFLPKTYSEEEGWKLLSRLPAPDFTALTPEKIPGSLYENMVKKVAPFGIRGVLWYQGESDDEVSGRDVYEEMLTTMIGDWRAIWGEEDLPFMIVQLPGWEKWLFTQNGDYAAIRRCQEAVTRKVKGTWLCSISDIGEQFDIHPKNKKDVGYRLALLAEGHVYGKEILCDAPCLKSAGRVGNRCTLTFSNAEGGLSVQGDEISALRVLRNEMEVNCSFTLEGDTLVLDLADGEGPVSVHFADTKWYQVNLYNRAGIPAIPFTVDL